MEKENVFDEIKGIGKKTAEKLIENGIDSVEKLAGLEPKEISEKTGVTVDTAKKYSDKAVENIKEKSKEDLEEKKKKLQEKAKELEKGLGEDEDLKQELEESRETLLPIEEYLKAGIYIGTKVITPHMKDYVYKRRNDGIATIDTNKTDEGIKEMIKKVSEYDPEDFIIVCKRESGWKAVEKFSSLTGVRTFTKKYPAGILTNTQLEDFFETKMVFICDPWIDKNVLNDARTVKSKIYAICDTNNYTQGIDFFIPANNKSNKSIGIIFYLLAKGYLEKRGRTEEAEQLKQEDFI